VHLIGFVIRIQIKHCSCLWCEHDESLSTYDLFFIFIFFRYKLNVWDVGGQKSLRSYWRNYFESTDGLIWVVDSADKRRLDDCRKELHALLREEVYYSFKQFMQFKIVKIYVTTVAQPLRDPLLEMYSPFSSTMQIYLLSTC